MLLGSKCEITAIAYSNPVCRILSGNITFDKPNTYCDVDNLAIILETRL